jgi:hypothetical protein
MYSKILTQDAWVRFEPLIEGTGADDLTPIDPMTLVDITQWLIGEGLGKEATPPQDS